MQLRDIQYAVTIAQESSFSKAAQSLFISQPALSQSIKRLESELGVPLFIRENNSVRLTAAGKIFVSDGVEILHMSNTLRTKMADIINLRDCHLKIGISTFYSNCYLPKIIPAFQSQYPSVHLEIIEETSNVLEELASDGKIDFCMIPGPLDSKQLEAQVIYQEQILMALFEGWRIYREYLERMQGLRGNQINTWNGQWLAHYFSDHFIEDEPLIGFQPFAAKEDGYEVVTRSWTDVLMAIAREIKDVRMMGYVYSLGQTNITVGFIPFVLTEIRRTVELYIKLFGMRNAKKAEHLFGTAYGFLRSCQMGMIGVSALEPKGLKEYMMKGKIPVYDAENEEKRINFYTYIIWILAMLNNEDLWEKSREIAQMLHTYVLGDKKSNMTRRNQVNKILETNSRMIFLNELQQIIPQIPDIKFAEDIGKLIHSMPVDNIPYFLTLVRFNYAIVCNQ